MKYGSGEKGYYIRAQAAPMMTSGKPAQGDSKRFILGILAFLAPFMCYGATIVVDYLMR